MQLNRFFSMPSSTNLFRNILSRNSLSTNSKVSWSRFSFSLLFFSYRTTYPWHRVEHRLIKLDTFRGTFQISALANMWKSRFKWLLNRYETYSISLSFPESYPSLLLGASSSIFGTSSSLRAGEGSFQNFINSASKKLYILTRWCGGAKLDLEVITQACLPLKAEAVRRQPTVSASLKVFMSLTFSKRKDSQRVHFRICSSFSVFSGGRRTIRLTPTSLALILARSWSNSFGGTGAEKSSTRRFLCDSIN